MEEEKEFSYDDFWKKKEESQEIKIKREIENFPKGSPRKGVKGRYLKPKNYISRRSSIKTMKSFAYNDKKVE
jgi:hypothetical protein